MIKFIRTILGLGPSETLNKSVIIKPTIADNKPQEKEIGSGNILPMLISQNTQTINLSNELVSIFHEREGIYSKIVIVYVIEDDLDNSGEPEISHISTGDKDEDTYLALAEKGQENLDNYDLPPFVFWNSVEKSYDFKILSTPMSFFASEKIISKKHMLEAHKLLDAEELYVSIPRRGLIFICSKDLTSSQYEDFLEMHYFLIINDKQKDLELLCEDIFVVKDGEIEGSLSVEQLSEYLTNKYK